MTTFPVTPDPSKVLIIDTSRWQNDPDTPKNVDYSQMKSKGASGVIMKVGQGLEIDRDWKVNVENTILAELPRGGYWFYDNRIEPKRQAEKMASAVKEFPLELGLWLDLEHRIGGAYKGWKNWYTFLEKLHELLPSAKIGIYTGYYYWVERTVSSQIPKASLQYFKKYPLWIASYNAVQKIPAPWTEYTIWQFTDLLDGKLYGAESIELDGSYFKGNLEEYQAFFGLSELHPSNPSQKFIIGLQEYALSLGGTLEDLKVIEVSSKTKREESVKLMNYILELDRKLQGE